MGVNASFRIVLVFKVSGDEGLAPSNFSTLAFLAGSVIAHLTRGVVGVVVFVAVRASDGVGADSEAFLSVLLV